VDRWIKDSSIDIGSPIQYVSKYRYLTQTDVL